MSEEEVEIFVFIAIGGGGRNIFCRNQNWVILNVDLFFSHQNRSSKTSDLFDYYNVPWFKSGNL